MLIAGFPAGAWGTNCYLVAPAAGEECVIIDPGHQAAPGVEEAIRKHRLKPVAVVLTHGHIDMWPRSFRCAAPMTCRPGSTPRTGS